MRRLRAAAFALASLLVPALAQANPPGHPPSDPVVFSEDFHEGFTADGADSNWFHLAIDNFIGNDGVETTSRHDGLTVTPAGRNPRTHQPAWTSTVGPDSGDPAIPGDIDHVKWLAYVNHTSSDGVPGFDAVPGKIWSCEIELGGRTYGTEQNPFGNMVEDPETDLRLGAVAMNVEDFSTFAVFDFFVTNRKIYAFYERLPSARTATYNYAAFSHYWPVADRTPDDFHKLKITYERSKDEVKYYVDGREVFTLHNVGYRLPPPFVGIDHGGTQEHLDLHQLDCGMGTFTLLDGFRPSEIGLVKLVPGNGYYLNPDNDSQPEPFWDDNSEASHRLWGQGAVMKVRSVTISSLPGSPDDDGHGNGNGHGGDGHGDGHGNGNGHGDDGHGNGHGGGNDCGPGNGHGH